MRARVILLVCSVGIAIFLRLAFSGANTETSRVANLTGASNKGSGSLNVAPAVAQVRSNLTLEEVQSMETRTRLPY